jgi:small subunit ribosomal protein S16
LVKIRLKRAGAHKRPFYKVIVADSRSPRDGKFIDLIGSYDPFLKSEKFKIDVEKAKKWISCGAQPTRIIKDALGRQCLS